MSATQHIKIQLKKAYTPVVAFVFITLITYMVASFAGLGATHPKTCTVYSVYILLCLITITSHRQNLLHPACLFVYASLLGFGLNIPLFCINYFPGVQYEDNIMAGVSLIVLTSTGATILGTLLLPSFKSTPAILKLDKPHPNAGLTTYLMCLGAIIFSGIIRITFHLGEPGVQPNFPLAGVLQFVLYEGNIVLALWYLSRALQGSIINIVLGLSLLAAIALIQALLGWRGGVFLMIIAGFGIFLLQDTNQKYRSPFWLILLGLAAVSLVNLGNQVRAEKLGGDSAYAKSEEGFITRILYRGQGTSRLAEIVKYFGDISATNDSMYKELADANLSATRFVDRELYGIQKNQSHSVGTSGPGGPYVNFGLLGVFIAYCGLGLFYKLIYNLIQASNTNNPSARIMYSYLIIIATQTQSENYGLLQIKSMLVITVLTFSFNYLVQAIFGARLNANLNTPLNNTTLEFTQSPAKPPALFRIQA